MASPSEPPEFGIAARQLLIILKRLVSNLSTRRVERKGFSVWITTIMKSVSITLEEMLEMAGVIIFIYALVRHIAYLKPVIFLRWVWVEFDSKRL